MYKLNNKVALITGAGKPNGIGKAIALRLAQEGVKVVINDLKSTKKNSDLINTVNEFKTLGHQVLSIETDVSSSVQVKKMVKKIINKFGKIDILVNNAATSPGKDRVPIVDIDEKIWDLIIKVNLKGTFLCCKEVGKTMINQKKGGKIINISSWAGKSYIQPNYGAYSTSKFAVRGLTQVLAKELGPYGIQVNAICPGAVITERTKKLAKALAPKGMNTNRAIKNYITDRLSGTPLGRLCTTNDIAQITAFLVSSESDFINGKSITVDGGKTTD